MPPPHMPRVHQLLPVFSPHDAMSAAAVAFQGLLRRLGHFGSVHAAEVAPGYSSLVRPASQLEVREDDWVLYHHGIASELAGTLMHLPCQKGVVFHNITPARYYRGTALEEALVSGRAQLAALAPHCALSLGVSHFNASELRVAGHTHVHTVPLFVEPDRFDAEAADAQYARQLHQPGEPLVLAVGRVVAHKRIEDLLRLHSEVRRLSPKARTLVIGPYAAGSTYFRSLPKLPGVTFAGSVSHAELVAAYRSADVLVSMSEHEGFGVPLIEAMAADLPVMAFSAAAVPETLGDRGIGFDEKHFALLAQLVLRLRSDLNLRAQVVEGQQQRVAELSADQSLKALGEALQTVGLTHGAPRPRRRGQPKVAVVVQRYGEHVTGGAEAHARQIAQRLAAHAELTVLTTTAVDHLTWADALPAGEERDGRVRVRRFACGGEREMRSFNRLSDSVFAEPQSRVAEEHWLAEQGPRAPGLLEHLADHCAVYDAVVFFTYLYAPTAWGLPLVADRALLVPTAHPEPPLAFGVYSDAFELPRALLCNTPEEAQLISQRFPGAARSRVVGVGIDAPSVSAQPYRPVEGPYLLYVGRREAGKGVKQLLQYHRALVRSDAEAPTLVLAGDGDLPARGPKVKALGRISEQQKFDALSQALAAVVPSAFESLSLLALEAFASGTPVLGNAASAVVTGHLSRSGAGFAFSDSDSYRHAVGQARAERATLSPKAASYAKRFRWPKVVDAYLEEIERIRKAVR